jgi:hypothetical protein
MKSSCQAQERTSKGTRIVGFEHRSVSTATSPLSGPSDHWGSAEAFSDPRTIHTLCIPEGQSS